MSVRWTGKQAATLCALAVFTWTYAVEAKAMGRLPLTIEVTNRQEETHREAEKPTVLVYHTHTWEAYEMTEGAFYTPTETWRTKDEGCNMIRIGEALTECLEERGFDVVHDTTAFEPPNLSEAYNRSLAMLEERDAGSRFDYILDVHRDAYSGDWNGGNTVEYHGKPTAYVMLLVGKGTGATGSGFDERPDWPENLALAEKITDALNGLVPGISRNVKIKPGRFNQHISTGALLIEVGNNRNTLDEALSACPLIADALAAVDAERRKGGSH